jgi:hypothetical protein
MVEAMEIQADDMRREPEWFPLIARSLRDGAALPPVYRWDLTEEAEA